MARTESSPETFETYEHYSDESIIVAARVTATGDYECRRYFTHGPVDTFVLDPEAFAGIYVPLKPAPPEAVD